MKTGVTAGEYDLSAAMTEALKGRLLFLRALDETHLRPNWEKDRFGGPHIFSPASTSPNNQMTRSSFDVGVRISQPFAVTSTVSSMRMPPQP
jgi:hypothetical protein